MWLSVRRGLQYQLYPCGCVCVLSSCECTSVNPAVPTVTYLGHLLRGRAGTCLWNSTWGTDKRGRLFSFILKDKHTWYSNTHALTRYDFNLSSHSVVDSAERLHPFICSNAYFSSSVSQASLPTQWRVFVEVCLRVCLCIQLLEPLAPVIQVCRKTGFFFFSSPTSQSCLQHKQESQLGVWHGNRGVEVEA